MAMDFVIIFFLLLNLVYVCYVLPAYFLSLYLRGRIVACGYVVRYKMFVGFMVIQFH